MSNVYIWPELKDQMRWWILFLQMCNRKMFIPNIEVWAIPIWSDAAGGSLVSYGHGAGCVIFPSFCVYVPLGMKINAGKQYDGKRMDRKLSCRIELGTFRRKSTDRDGLIKR